MNTQKALWGAYTVSLRPNIRVAGPKVVRGLTLASSDKVFLDPKYGENLEENEYQNRSQKR